MNYHSTFAEIDFNSSYNADIFGRPQVVPSPVYDPFVALPPLVQHSQLFSYNNVAPTPYGIIHAQLPPVNGPVMFTPPLPPSQWGPNSSSQYLGEQQYQSPTPTPTSTLATATAPLYAWPTEPPIDPSLLQSEIPVTTAPWHLASPAPVKRRRPASSQRRRKSRRLMGEKPWLLEEETDEKDEVVDVAPGHVRKRHRGVGGVSVFPIHRTAPTHPHTTSISTDTQGHGHRHVHGFYHYRGDGNDSEDEENQVIVCEWMLGSCAYSTRSKTEMLDHVMQSHVGQHLCSERLPCLWHSCDSRSSEMNYGSMKKHLQTDLGITVPCPDCNQHFTRTDSMNRHRKSCTGPEDKLEGGQDGVPERRKPTLGKRRRL